MAFSFERADNREGYKLYKNDQRAYIRRLSEADLNNLLKIAELEERVVNRPRGCALRHLVEMERALRADEQRNLMDIFPGLEELDNGPWKWSINK